MLLHLPGTQDIANSNIAGLVFFYSHAVDILEQVIADTPEVLEIPFPFGEHEGNGFFQVPHYQFRPFVFLALDEIGFLAGGIFVVLFHKLLHLIAVYFLEKGLVLGLP